MPVFTPEFIFKDVTCITPAFLEEQGIEALVLDVDNTLTGHGSQHVSPEVEAWIATMRAAGIKMMIASNNYKRRVAPFAAKLGLEYASFCCKPFPKWLHTANRKWNLPKDKMALVGDQIFTDAWAGHSAGVKVFLVQPIYEDPKAGIRFKRLLERPFINKYYRRGGKLL